MSDQEKDYYRVGMNKIYYYYLDAIEKDDRSNIIFKIFLDKQSKEYFNNTNYKRMVIDFIAGMTDDMFLHEIERVSKL